jgi:hypothetical protein
LLSYDGFERSGLTLWYVGNIEQFDLKKKDALPMEANNCLTCSQPMSKIPETLNLDCGGDCLNCMAWHGDPDAIEFIERLTGNKVDVKGSSYRSP